MINTIVGSGTLITFPTLLFFGVNPLVANVSNNIGLVAGGVTGAWATGTSWSGQAATCAGSCRCRSSARPSGAGLLLVLARRGLPAPSCRCSSSSRSSSCSLGPRIQRLGRATPGGGRRPGRLARAGHGGRRLRGRRLRRLLRGRPGRPAHGHPQCPVSTRAAPAPQRLQERPRARRQRRRRDRVRPLRLASTSTGSSCSSSRSVPSSAG